MEPAGPDRIRFVMKTSNASSTSVPVRIEPNHAYRLIITSHGPTDRLSVKSDKRTIFLGNALFAKGRITVSKSVSKPGQASGATVVGVVHRPSSVPLCRSLLSGSVNPAS